MQKLRACVIGLLLASLLGCGGGNEITPAASSAGSPPSAPSQTPSDPPAQSTSPPPGDTAPSSPSQPPATTPPASSPPTSTPPATTPPATTPPGSNPPVTTPAANSPAPAAVIHRAIWIGDSLAARGWASAGSAFTASGQGFVVSGGPSNPVATITVTANHGLLPGNYVQIYNVGDPTYGAVLNGVVTRVIATPTPQQFTVSATLGGQTMPNGDYSAGFAGQPWLVASMAQTTDASWLQWLNLYMKGNFAVVASYAQGGTPSDVGIKLLSKIRSGPKAEYAFIQYCTNDVNAGTPDPSGCLANIQELVTAVEALGMIPILSTPTAIGDPQAQPSNPARAQANAALQTIVRGEQQMAQNDRSIVLFDTYALTIDSASAIGGFLPNYAPVDGLHPSTFGEIKLAQALSAVLQSAVPVSDVFPTTSTDWATANLVPNGLMAGTNGRLSSSTNNEVTGSVPTGWSLTPLGGTSAAPITLAVSGNNSHANVAGHTLDVTVTTAAGGASFQLGTNAPNGSSFDASLTAGSWYRCGFQLDALTALSHFNLSGQVFLNYGGGSTASIYFMNPDSRYDNGMPLDAGASVQFISTPFFVPTRPTAGAFLFINGTFSGAVAGQTFSLGRAFCAAIASPYE